VTRRASFANGLAGAALAPLLIVQGLYVRRTAPRLPEPSGPREGVGGEGPELRLLLLGDSAAAGVGASTQGEALSGQLAARLGRSFRVSWRLLAKTGATTAQALSWLEEEPASSFDAALTSLGVNDVTSGRVLGAWLRDQARLECLLRDKFSVRILLLSGLPPVGRFLALPQPLRWWLGRRAERFDAALEAWASSRPGCEYVGLRSGGGGDVPVVGMMASDGFHPGPAIYALWAQTAARRIEARLGGPAG
jgi:lysophospholipase L1-like esterase